MENASRYLAACRCGSSISQGFCRVSCRSWCLSPLCQHCRARPPLCHIPRTPPTTIPLPELGWGLYSIDLLLQFFILVSLQSFIKLSFTVISVTFFRGEESKACSQPNACSWKCPTWALRFYYQPCVYCFQLGLLYVFLSRDVCIAMMWIRLP